MVEDLNEDYKEAILKGFMSLPLMGIVIDLKEGKFVEVNKCFLNNTGYLREDIVGKTIMQLPFCPKPLEVLKQFSKLKKQGHEVKKEVEIKKKEGGVLNAICSSQLVKTKSRDYVISVAEDVTKVRLVEEKFRQITEVIEDVFWITNWEDKKVTYASPAFEKIWGIKLEVLYGKPDVWANAIHPDDKEKAYESFLSLEKEKTYDETYRIIRPDKTVRWIRDRGYPIKNENGEVINIIGIAHDITERKKNEREMEERAISLDKFGKIAIGRELRMIELKREINGLLKRLGEEPEYDVD